MFRQQIWRNASSRIFGKILTNIFKIKFFFLETLSKFQVKNVLPTALYCPITAQQYCS